MNLENLLEAAPLVDPEETLAHVAVKMMKEKLSEVFVFENDFKGVVTADDIVKRTVSSPHEVKISYFMKPAKVFSLEDSLEDVINYMMVSEYKSVRR